MNGTRAEAWAFVMNRSGSAIQQRIALAADTSAGVYRYWPYLVPQTAADTVHLVEMEMENVLPGGYTLDVFQYMRIETVSQNLSGIWR